MIPVSSMLEDLKSATRLLWKDKSFTATVAGKTVTYRAEVCNQGAGTSATFAVELYYDRTGAPGCFSTHDRRFTVAGLGPRGCQVVTYSRTGTPNGSYRAWVAKQD